MKHQPTGDAEGTDDQAAGNHPRRPPSQPATHWGLGSGSYRAALLMSLPVVPLAAGLVATLSYAASVETIYALLAGVAVLAAGGPLLACFLRPFTTADAVNPRTYRQLDDRLLQLDVRLRRDEGRSHALSDDAAVLAEQARREAQSYRNQAWDCLKEATHDTRWIQGSGYIDAWNLVHRAEEALIECEPIEQVISDALYDEMRLEGARIDTASQMRAKLRTAIGQLRPSAAIYLAQSPAASPAPANGGAPSGVPPESVPAAGVPGADGAPAAQPTAAPAPKRTLTTVATEGAHARGMQARTVLREIRQTINTFRDDGWDCILRARNQLIGSVIAMGIVTCILVFTALLVGVSRLTLTGVLWLYLIGAAVGLFNRLYIESKVDTAVDDYGLATARLIAMIVFSGLAAVGGALFVALLSGTMESGAQSLTLAQAFDLSNHPLSIVVAGVFGLAPGLLISTLQQQAAKYSGDIASSQATSIPSLRTMN